jgi:hypothetical protein
MKKLLVSIIAVALASSVAYADMKQEDASIGLSVPQIIELVGIDMEETIVPGPEDYARDLEVTAVVNDQGLEIAHTGGDTATENVMHDANCDIGKGFAEATNALSMTIFTNAQDGAALYVHGSTPAGPTGILRLEDTYIQVCKEKTYILQNNLEGAFANAASVTVAENKGRRSSRVARVIDNPRVAHEDRGANPAEDFRHRYLTSTQDLRHIYHEVDYNIESNPTVKACSTWLRIHHQAQHIFEVKMATAAPRLIVFNIGIANLARYTEGDYSNTLTFTLMPIVG